MSPKAGLTLTNEIVPRIRSAMRGCVQPVAAEDHEELIQDCTAIAAGMLDRVEASGKQVTSGNIAYYAVLKTKAGRRSTGNSVSDALAAGTQITGRSYVHSLEDETSIHEIACETVVFGDLLVSEVEDPGETAARELDWEWFLSSHDPRYRSIVERLVRGDSFCAACHGNGPASTDVYVLRRQLAADLQEFMGDEILRDVTRRAPWKADADAVRSRAFCRIERRSTED